MSIKTNVEVTALRKVYDYLDQDPVNRLPKLGEQIDRYVKEGVVFKRSAFGYQNCFE